MIISSSCKKELDVKNPNNPTLEQASNESGLISLASGGVYINGFGNSFLNTCIPYYELMADNIASTDPYLNRNNVNLLRVRDFG